MSIATEKTIIVDYNLPKQHKQITFLQYDTNIIKFVVEDNGEPADLSNITNIIVNFRRKDKTVISQVLTAVGNVITYRLTDSEMLKPGECDLALQLYANEERLTIAIIKVKIDENIENGEEPSDEDVGLITKIIENVSGRLVELDEFGNQLTSVQNGLAGKRDKSEKIKGTDLDVSADENKIKFVNLSDEVQRIVGIALTSNMRTADFESILSKFPEGKIYVKGDASKAHNIDQELVIQNKEDILFEDINFSGDIFRSISIKDCKNITFRNCKFYNMQRVLSLYNTENITVDNCTFDYCGYCILGMDGYSQKTTRVINNDIYNARADFVEMNSNQVESSDVLIYGNVFHGSSYDVIHPTHLYREQRFAGITSVKNVIITNNTVKGTFASAIHVEVAQGQCIIENNTFEHCVIKRKTESGNRLGGVIEISGNAKDMIISGNYFIKDENYIDSDGQKDDSCFLWFNYHESTRPIIISNNIFDGRGLPSWTAGTSKRSGFLLNKGGIIFEGNKLINCSGFDISGSSKLSITNNQFDGPIFSNLTAPTNCMIANNTITVKDDVLFSIKLRELTPTQPLNAKNIIITGNFINKPIEMRYPKNVILSNNMMPASTYTSTQHIKVDDILFVFPNTLTVEDCNIKASNNLVAIEGGDEWHWVDPIPDVVTPHPEEIPLHG